LRKKIFVKTKKPSEKKSKSQNGRQFKKSKSNTRRTSQSTPQKYHSLPAVTAHVLKASCFKPDLFLKMSEVTDASVAPTARQAPCIGYGAVGVASPRVHRHPQTSNTKTGSATTASTASAMPSTALKVAVGAAHHGFATTSAAAVMSTNVAQPTASAARCVCRHRTRTWVAMLGAAVARLNSHLAALALRPTTGNKFVDAGITGSW